jgi:hypothetical protein
MVSPYIDMLVTGVRQVPAVEIGLGEVVVLPEQVVTCKDAGSHILKIISKHPKSVENIPHPHVTGQLCHFARL